MIKTIRNLFCLCNHEWEIIDQVDVYDPKYYKHGLNVTVGTDYTLQCKKCGNIKVRKVR